MIAYCITNLWSRKKYIGIARCVEDRWRRHLKAAAGKGRRYALHDAMAKYGQDAFSFEVVACARTWADLQALETLLIAQHNTLLVGGHGYNMTRGGDGTVGYRHSEEGKAAMRVARLRWTITPETGAKISQSLRGKKRTLEQRENYRAAIIARGGITPEIRQKRADKWRGVPLSPEHRAKLSEARRGKPKSEAHKAAISRANRGRSLSPEARAKISAARRAAEARRRAEAPQATLEF